MELIEKKKNHIDITPHLNQAVSVAGVWKLDHSRSVGIKKPPARNEIKFEFRQTRGSDCDCSIIKSNVFARQGRVWRCGPKCCGFQLRVATVCARVTSEVLRVYGRHKWNESRSARWGSGASIDALLFSARRHRREQQLGRYKAPQLCSGRGTRLDEQLRCSQYIYDPYTKWDEISLDSIKRVNASAAQSLSTPTHS